MHFYCTYFDSNYLPRGLALYGSLARHCAPFRLWVLCLDRACFDVLSQLALPHLRLITLEDLEDGDQDLVRARANRTPVEYYFTCTPSLPLFLLNNCAEIDAITYLDSDLFFFADPAPIFDEMAGRSIAIIGHRFPPAFRYMEQQGIYNVGWLSFRRDQHALDCLRWWRERCIEWCYDRVEEGRFADQKYLDDWPTRFPGVVVLQHKGANLAPWNLANYRLDWVGNHLRVDDEPLLFFHFHGLKQIEHWVFHPAVSSYNGRLSTIVRRGIYGPYMRALWQAARRVSHLLPGVSPIRSVRRVGGRPSPHRPGRLIGGTLSRLRSGRAVLQGLLDERYFIAISGHVV